MSVATMRLEDFDTETRYEARVASTQRISPPDAEAEVCELVLEIAPPERAFEPGQCVGVLAPGSSEFGHRHHFRLYSVADVPACGPDGNARITICVRRCFYIDHHSGERYPGIASNFLCDLRPGDPLTVTGPVGHPFEVPADHAANLVLIGSGTGIAPFRALVRRIYRDVGDWTGRVWLFHGARSGLELLYMNEERDDFAEYYDEETFQAFRVLSPRPNWADPIAWDEAIAERGDELWRMLEQPNTYVYVAGLEEMHDRLERVFTDLAGSQEAWRRRKAELAAGGRWVELLY